MSDDDRMPLTAAVATMIDAVTVDAMVDATE